MKQIHNKDPVYRTGNHIKYLIMTKNLKKNIYVCMYISINHFAVHSKLTQYCKATTVNQ